jgi:UrcA family protein
MPLFATADPGCRDTSERFSAVVPLSDLDLKTQTGVRAARERIRQTALRLCRKFSDSRKISDRETLADCVRQSAVGGTLATLQAYGANP